MRHAGQIFGMLLILAGVVWFFQGIGLLPGSLMTGQIFWAYAGAVSALIGAGVLVVSFWR